MINQANNSINLTPQNRPTFEQPTVSEVNPKGIITKQEPARDGLHKILWENPTVSKINTTGIMIKQEPAMDCFDKILWKNSADAMQDLLDNGYTDIRKSGKNLSKSVQEEYEQVKKLHTGLAKSPSDKKLIRQYVDQACDFAGKNKEFSGRIKELETKLSKICLATNIVGSSVVYSATAPLALLPGGQFIQAGITEATSQGINTGINYVGKKKMHLPPTPVRKQLVESGASATGTFFSTLVRVLSPGSNVLAIVTGMVASTSFNKIANSKAVKSGKIAKEPSMNNALKEIAGTLNHIK